jgi:hypothetical protein
VSSKRGREAVLLLCCQWFGETGEGRREAGLVQTHGLGTRDCIRLTRWWVVCGMKRGDGGGLLLGLLHSQGPGRGGKGVRAAG